LNIRLLPTESSGCARIPKIPSTGVSVLRMTKQDIFTRGNRFLLNRTPGTLCHHNTSHSRASSHEDTPPRDLSLSHVPATGTSHGKHLGSILRQDLSSRLVVDPARSTRPSPHTQDSRQDLPRFIIRLLLGLRHLVPISYGSHSPASHHRYNASKSKAVSNE
jgi:hypothetical protein